MKVLFKWIGILTVLFSPLHTFGTNNATLLPKSEVLSMALRGFNQLKSEGQISEDKYLVTVIDYSLSANQKRLWVIDVRDTSVLHHSLVSHGKNSGNEYAVSFSNKEQSYKSSLGFFVTANTYHGKHGYSLRLDGLEYGVNHNARERAIVIHGASYVCNSFIRRAGRLGRSHGCPALPVDQSKDIIDTIKNGCCVFAYYPDKKYLASSKILNKTS